MFRDKYVLNADAAAESSSEGAAASGLLVVGSAANSGKSSLLRRLHRQQLARAPDSSMRLAALLDAVSANSCRNDLQPFCLSRRARLVLIDDVDALPPAVQHILAALIDQCRAGTAAAAAGKAGCAFVLSCSATAKVLPALLVRLPALCLPAPDAHAVRAFAARVAREEGVRFEPAAAAAAAGDYGDDDDAWEAFARAHCNNPRAALSALEKLALLTRARARRGEPDAVTVDDVRDDKDRVWRTLLDPRAGAARAADAFTGLLAKGQGYALADLLDFFFLHIRDSLGHDQPRQIAWLEHIGRAMRALPPPPPPPPHTHTHTHTHNTKNTNDDDDVDVDDAVPWFCVLAATEKSLL